MGKYDKVLSNLSPNVRKYVAEKAEWCQPDDIHICDGSEAENNSLLQMLTKMGTIKPYTAYKNSWLANTDPDDVARVESKTVISTARKSDTIPTPAEGIKGTLGNWMSPEELKDALGKRFPGCMKGRTMYVIPFSMGPVGGPISKVGVQLTDSGYVVISMRIMTRMGKPVLDLLNKDDSFFVKALHSVGLPKPEQRPVHNSWPCNPPMTIISHIPDNNEICSFGSGYGGNSLLGKKCFALRIGSTIAKREGWFAEHMLILGITTPQNTRHYIAAAFPSCCGKTNLAMLQPTLPGYTVTCVGDDIAWMKFDEDGRLRAINPEAGFFGVAPGTSKITNPNALATIQSNTIFTNTAELSDGRFYWEGLEDTVDLSTVKVTDWKRQPWTPASGVKAAHPNSRFCTPAAQCPIIDPLWEDPKGVPIDAIVFGGRRPEGIPLVYQSLSWEHGVFVGSAVRSETTAAAEHKGKAIMHDPFAMRPFFGYNFGHYMQHWLKFNKNPKLQLPKIFHVNWFRKDKNPPHSIIWPGFCENMRVIDWMLKRIEGRVGYQETAIGLVPRPGDIDLTGLSPKPDMEQLLSVEGDFWRQEVKDIRKYYNEQLPHDLPEEIDLELKRLEARVSRI